MRAAMRDKVYQNTQPQAKQVSSNQHPKRPIQHHSSLPPEDPLRLRSQLMIKSLLFLLLFSMLAARCRFLKHQPTKTRATTEGIPIATPSPTASGLFILDPPPLWLLFPGTDDYEMPVVSARSESTNKPRHTGEGFGPTVFSFIEKNGVLANKADSPAAGCNSSWYMPFGTCRNGNGTPVQENEATFTPTGNGCQHHSLIQMKRQDTYA